MTPVIGLGDREAVGIDAPLAAALVDRVGLLGEQPELVRLRGRASRPWRFGGDLPRAGLAPRAK